MSQFGSVSMDPSNPYQSAVTVCWGWVTTPSCTMPCCFPGVTDLLPGHSSEECWQCGKAVSTCSLKPQPAGQALPSVGTSGQCSFTFCYRWLLEPSCLRREVTPALPRTGGSGKRAAVQENPDRPVLPGKGSACWSRCPPGVAWPLGFYRTDIHIVDDTW